MEKGDILHKRMIRAVELVFAALLGAILANMLNTLWTSNDPLNLTAILFIVLFLAVTMLLVFIFYSLVALTHKIIYKK